eukprot:5863362-Prymnesium_polylepis.3
MREAHVGFTVIQDREPTGLEVFLYSFTVTMLIIWVIGALGLMEDLVWGLAIAGMSLYSAIAEVPPGSQPSPVLPHPAAALRHAAACPSRS